MNVSTKPVPVLYLDLDGTVRHGFNELGRFVNDPSDVTIFPEALKLMRKYKSEGYRIAAISNQGGVALGHMSYEQCYQNMLKTFELCEGLFDKMCFCVHHPEAKDPEMATCWCRKPRCGMVLEAAIAMGKKYPEHYPPHMALFVGDRPEDEACAMAANIKFMDASEWRKSL